MIFIKKDIAYYDTGEGLFRPGEEVFINRAIELPEKHLHAHSFIEIAYVLSGTGIHCIGDTEYTVSKGDLFVINYDVPHEFRSLKDSRQPALHVYNCIFKPGFIDSSLINSQDFSTLTYHFLFRSFFPEENENRADIRILDEDDRSVEELYEKMFREYSMQEDGYVEILRAYVIELLVTIFRLCKRHGKLSDNLYSQRSKIMENVIRYMKENYSHPIKLSDLSVMAFLSRNYFCRLFKEYTGITVSEYVQKIRIEEACRLLQSTGKKVIDIALEVGYNDLKFFNRIFKRQTGKTPGEYKKLSSHLS